MPDNSEPVRTAPIRALRAVFAGVGQLLLAADKFRSEYEEVDTEDQNDPFRTWENPEAAGGKASDEGGEETMRLRKNRSRQEDQPRRFRSLDLTGNVRVLTPAELAEQVHGDAGDRPAAAPEPAAAGAPEPAPGEPAEPVFAVPSSVISADPPLPPTAAPDLGPEISVWGAEASIWPAEPSPRPASDEASQAATALVAELPIDGYDGLSIASLRARLRTLDVAQLQVLLDHERSGAGRDEFVTMLERRIGKLTAVPDDAS